MRNTVHLVTAEDYVSFRPLVQPRLDRALAGSFGRRLDGVDLAALAGVAAPLLTERALTRVELARALAPHWPAHDPEALAYAATHLLALVQVPPRPVGTGWAGRVHARLGLAGRPGPGGPAAPVRRAGRRGTAGSAGGVPARSRRAGPAAFSA